MPKYYPISEDAARRANDLNSYRDYKSGSATASYQAQVDAAYQLAEEQKQKVDPMYHNKIDYLVDLYARKLAENLNQAHAIDARVPSILVAGGGNFPVQKKLKQNAARDKNMGEYHLMGGNVRHGQHGGQKNDCQLLDQAGKGLPGLQATH